MGQNPQSQPIKTWRHPCSSGQSHNAKQLWPEDTLVLRVKATMPSNYDTKIPLFFGSKPQCWLTLQVEATVTIMTNQAAGAAWSPVYIRVWISIVLSAKGDIAACGRIFMPIQAQRRTFGPSFGSRHGKFHSTSQVTGLGKIDPSFRHSTNC